MAKKRKSRKHGHRHGSSLRSKLYQILSGASHRVVASTKKLSTARRRARGLVSRGSKHVSIRRGGQTFAVGARHTSRGHRRRRTSKSRVSANRHHRRVSRNKHRKHDKRRVSKDKHRRTSKHKR